MFSLHYVLLPVQNAPDIAVKKSVDDIALLDLQRHAGPRSALRAMATALVFCIRCFRGRIRPVDQTRRTADVGI